MLSSALCEVLLKVANDWFFTALQIYGIRCHLLHKFNITERDWYRIKQNMDSKCRTAWKKKVRGLPLGGFKVS